MTEFDILRAAAEASLEKEEASEGEIALARLVIAYGSTHRDVSQKTLSALRERCSALLDCFRSLRSLVDLLEARGTWIAFTKVLDEAKKALEKARKYG